jgi:hypothetical protein
MHIHNQPVNLYATNVHSPVRIAAQQAAEICRRLARAASSLGEESDPFESSMVGQAPDEASRRQRSRGRPNCAKTLVAEEEEPTGTLSLHA